MAKEQVKHEMAYHGGLAEEPDALELPEGTSPDLENVELYKGVLRRARGLNDYVAGTTADRILVLATYEQWDGDKILMIITDEKVEYLNASTITNIGDLAGTDGRFISTDTAEDLFIFTDYVNVVKSYDGTTYQALSSDLASILAKCCLSFANHLFLMNISDTGTVYSSRILWNHTGDVTDWTGANSGQANIVETTGSIINGARLGLDRAYIYKSDSIWEVTYLGGTVMFDFHLVQGDVGLAAPKSLVSHKSIHYFMGNDGIYAFNGRELKDLTDSESGKRSIRPIIFGTDSTLNRDVLDTACAIFVPDLQEYWIALAVDGNTKPRDIFRCHIPTRSWWRKSYGYDIYAMGTWGESITVAWSAAVGTWADAEGPWKSAARAASFPQTLISVFDTVGEIKKADFTTALDDGVYPSAHWASRDYNAGYITRWTEVWTELKGTGTMTLHYSTDEGTSYTALQTLSIDSSEWDWYKWWPDFTTDNVRFKWTWDSGFLQMRQRAAFHLPKKR